MEKFISDDHRQIFLGSLLGNGYICRSSKNYYFCMRHSLRHTDWLKTKALELRSYQSSLQINNIAATWRSACNPVFNELHKLCYTTGKQVTMTWLNQLRDLAIAIWYGDKGTLVGRNYKNACLRTQAFGLDGNKIIEQFFNEVGVPCHINKSRNSYIIVFTVVGTEILMSKLVAKYLPKNRYFKIPNLL